MKNQNSQHFLTDGEGHRIPVSEKVYTAYWRYTNKEDYFMRLLKEERFLYDPERQIAEFVPSREDSFERLLEEGEEFACEQKPVEEQVVSALLVQKIMENMTDDERDIVYQTFVLGKSDQEASESLGVLKDTYKSRRQTMLSKYGELFKKIQNYENLFVEKVEFSDF